MAIDLREARQNGQPDTPAVIAARRARTVPGWICNGIVDGTYAPGPAGPAWGSFGIEQQASIVDQWFAGGPGQRPTTVAPAMDQNSAYFPYISGDIRNAVT